MDKADWRKSALLGAGAGVWRWDHRRNTAQLCSGAAQLLAGDATLANHDLTPDEALAQVHADDLEQLRARLQAATYCSPSQIGQCRLRSAAAGDRLVLLRGSTHLTEDGEPDVTTGVVIDLTDVAGIANVGSTRDVDDALDETAHHGMAAYDAIQASGVASLLGPARMLLLAIGHELAARMKNTRAH